MKFLTLIAEVVAISLSAFSVASGQDLPSLTNDLCDYDTIYDSIRTGNIVEVTLQVRYRNCPANRDNKPCRAENSQGYAEGALLNGVQSDNAIVLNDEIPGPEIRAKLGDTIRVNIVNHLGEPTTMHFHGMTQFRTPFMDGDEMISNCPIAAGHSHVYEFIAHPAGTTFYHSHSGSQRVAGMTGPLVIEDDEEAYADVPDRHVFIQDWSNQNSDSNFEFWSQNTPSECITFGGDYFTGLLNPRRDINFVGAVVGDGMLFQSFIINGQGIYQHDQTQIPDLIGETSFQDMQCPGQYTSPPRCEYCLNQENWTGELCTTSSGDSHCGQPAVIEVDAGTETRLRFAHAGGLFASQVCIDGHGVDLITADGTAIEPYSTDCFIIFTAERYDAIIKPTTPGDYWIRFTTTEQQTAASFDTETSANVKTHTDGFPHQGYAILRVKDPAATSAEPKYLSDYSPIACDGTTTVNCGEDYWLSSKTMGCASGPSRLHPERCVTSFAALKPATTPSPNSDASLCASKKMPHEVEATIKATAALGFIPDEVPRWEGLSLNSRIELLMEEEHGFPYITPDDSAEWGSHQPISFVNPDSPPLSLSPEQRAKLYAKRTVFREIDEENASENFPNYPVNFNQGVMGPNAIVANYGDVIRIYFSCTAPYGPGCAMPHPMHLHGNKMAILYSGEWDEEYDESKFSQNPVYRDTVTVNTDSFTVVQVAATNPGAWRWHCHVNIHHKSGMAMILDVGGDSDVEAVRATPESVNLCPIRADNSEAAEVVEPEVAGGQPVVTEGKCGIDVRLQSEDEDPPVGVPTDWHPDNNIIVKLPGSDCDVAISPTWTIAGWDSTIVQIAPNTVFKPPAVGDDERQLVKIMRGTLLDVNVNGIYTEEHWETHTITPPNRAISMYIDNSVDEIKAGTDGAVIVYMKVTEEILKTPITDMNSSPATDIAGPYSEHLKWNNFGDITEWGFEGVEFYNLAGILLQENDGSRLGYMQFWTFREDSNADGYHDHSNLNKDNAFGEIHMAMYAANGVSGMQTTLMGTENKNWKANPADTGVGNSFAQNDQTEVQIAIPMPPGFAHGPLWSVDPATGEPTRTCAGGIQYPFHRWLISANGVLNDPLRYSMWVAYEHLPEDVTVPLKMLTEWPNANLQTTMTEAECAKDPPTPAPVTSPTEDVDKDDSPVEDGDSGAGKYSSYTVTFMVVALASIFVVVA